MSEPQFDPTTALTQVESDTKPAKRKRGQRGTDLTGSEIADILRWSSLGLTQEQIAAKCVPYRSQSTISDVLAKFGPDRTVEAKAILRSLAPDMAYDVARFGKGSDKVKALEGLEVLANSEVRGGLTIVVGGNAQVQVNLGTSIQLEPTLRSDNLDRP